jgi:hypothetical protein
VVAVRYRAATARKRSADTIQIIAIYATHYIQLVPLFGIYSSLFSVASYANARSRQVEVMSTGEKAEAIPKDVTDAA